jgi:ATP-dependent helicase YprA (DUF1998 family)
MSGDRKNRVFDGVDLDHLEEQFTEDDLFDDLDVDELLNRSTNPPKRSFQDDEKCNNVSASSKRARGDHDSPRPTSPSGDPSMIELARRILMDKFGHKAFRHEQERSIQKTLQGENSLVVFPTGAGKSLCYQVCNSLFALVASQRVDTVM